MAFIAALALAAGGPAWAAGGSDAADGVVGQDKPIICDNQTYALCAGASCFVFNNVAYCSCTVHTGRSISSPFKYGPGGTSNICTVNGQGPGNGYMASTFSLPDSLKAPRGRQALYKCPRTLGGRLRQMRRRHLLHEFDRTHIPGLQHPVGKGQNRLRLSGRKSQFLSGP